MDFEKIEQAYTYLLENVHVIQSDLLKGWLKDEVSLAAIIALPEDIFSTASQAKSIFVLQKKRDKEIEPFVYPLTSLQDPAALLKFKENFQKWSKGTEI